MLDFYTESFNAQPDAARFAASLHFVACAQEAGACYQRVLQAQADFRATRDYQYLEFARALVALYYMEKKQILGEVSNG